MTSVSRQDLLNKVAEAFRSRGLRATPQRLAVAEVVLRTDRHPTVHEVYHEVRRSFPTTGLATVYNTLHALAELGFVQELTYADRLRFDADTTPHINLVCTQCGEISDAHEWDTTIERLRHLVGDAYHFDVHAQRLDFYGLCGSCRRQEGSRDAGQR